MRALASLIGVLTVALLPAAARAQAPSPWMVSTSGAPCYVGSCAPYLMINPASLARPPVLVSVDWDHQGAADGPLVPDAQQTCGVAPPPPGGPPTFQPPCSLYGAPYPASGDHLVAFDLRQTDGTTERHTQVVTALALPAPPVSTPPATPYLDPADAEPVLPRPVTKTPSRTPSRTPTRKRPSRRTPARGGYALCRNVPANVSCRPGNGQQTAGGGEKVSHRGWPRITGVFWKVHDSRGHPKTGGPDNDELLGHHGSDRLDGGAGHDVLWGDWDPANNRTGQHDVLRGGAGNDFIYPSHGQTEVAAGTGKDYIWAFYGHGTIDCGPGYDTVRVRTNGAFSLHNCEVVGHFCQYGPDGHGGCRKPGAARAARRRDAG